jgi:TRAP transporter TAXI family solute receptor
MIEENAMRRGLALGSCCLLAGALVLGPALADDTSLDRGTRGVVELETGGTDGISGQTAADLAYLLNDGATRRVVPVIGDGALQNIIDLKSLKGLDLAIIQADALAEARRQKLFPGVETIAYVARLYNEEFHLVARADIKSVADLAGQKVAIGVDGGGSSITATRVFAQLGIAIQPVKDAPSVALAKLAHGDIAAVALVAGRPAPLLRMHDGTDGLHLLAVPMKGDMATSYAPTRLTAKDYPGLIGADAPVDTVAVGVVLAAANLTAGSDRARNLANFVDAFFTQFPTLLEPGHEAKWSEVNLAADLPGWHRLPAADQWLASNAPVAKATAPQELRTVFERFLDERLKLNGAAMSQQQKDELFSQFEHWQTQAANPPR